MRKKLLTAEIIKCAIVFILVLVCEVAACNLNQ
jgi:hypothetical protein